MLPHEAVVHRAVHRVATGFVLLNLPLSVLACVQHPHAYLPGVAVTVTITALALGLWSVERCLRGESAARPLTGIVAVSYLALLTHLWAFRPDRAQYPPLFHLLGAGMGITVITGVRIALVGMPAFAAMVAVIRTPALGPVPAAAEALLLLLSGLIATAGVALLDRANRTVVSAVSTRAAVEEDARRSSLRTFERERWDGLIHDKVLGALRIAGRDHTGGTPAAARELASDALAAFRGDRSMPARTPAQAWRELAERLGLAADIRVTGAVEDEDVSEVLVQAAGEAITNVARHSGQDRVVVVARLSDDECVVTVTDHGRGFEALAQGFGTGLRTSVVGRLGSIGGTAHITSVIGRGTRVDLRWRPQPVASTEDAQWQLATFAPMMILGAAALVLNIVLGARQWLGAPSRTTVVLGILTVVAITAATAFLAPEARATAAVLPAIAVTCTVLAMDTAPGAGPDWRYWYLGALTPAVGAMAFRYRRGAGLLGAAVAVVAVLLVDRCSGRPMPGPLAGPAPVLLGTTVAGHLLRNGLDRAWAQVSEVVRAEGQLRLRIAADQERAREAARRVQALAGVVGPALERICAAPRLTQPEAAGLLLLEGAVRDQLAAPTLVDPELALALARSRARAVRVDLAVRGGEPSQTDDDTDPGLNSFRHLLTAVLQTAAPSSRVRVTWNEDSSRLGRTIAVIGTNPDEVEAVAHSSLMLLAPQAAYRVLVTADQDCVLIEFPPP